MPTGSALSTLGSTAPMARRNTVLGSGRARLGRLLPAGSRRSGSLTPGRVLDSSGPRASVPHIPRTRTGTGGRCGRVSEMARACASICASSADRRAFACSRSIPDSAGLLRRVRGLRTDVVCSAMVLSRVSSFMTADPRMLSGGIARSFRITARAAVKDRRPPQAASAFRARP